MPITLVIRTTLDSWQGLFEHRATSQMGINAGMFSINEKHNQYVNPHVQWMWVQFQKGVVA